MTGPHLSDVALAEWARRRDVIEAPESRFQVEAHLMRCGACGARLRAHEDLERACDPWFVSPGAAPASAPPPGRDV